MPHHAVIRLSSETLRVSSVSSFRKGFKAKQWHAEDACKLPTTYNSNRSRCSESVSPNFRQRRRQRCSQSFVVSDTPKLDQGMPEIQKIRMTRVPFRTTASPLLLTAALLYHLQQINDRCPVTTKKLETCFYDLALGTDAAEEACRFFGESNTIFFRSRNVAAEMDEKFAHSFWSI